MEFSEKKTKKISSTSMKSAAQITEVDYTGLDSVTVSGFMTESKNAYDQNHI